jgi:hypothetical protein
MNTERLVIPVNDGRERMMEVTRGEGHGRRGTGTAKVVDDEGDAC